LTRRPHDPRITSDLLIARSGRGDDRPRRCARQLEQVGQHRLLVGQVKDRVADHRRGSLG